METALDAAARRGCCAGSSNDRALPHGFRPRCRPERDRADGGLVPPRRCAVHRSVLRADDRQRDEAPVQPAVQSHHAVGHDAADADESPELKLCRSHLPYVALRFDRDQPDAGRAATAMSCSPNRRRSIRFCGLRTRLPGCCRRTGLMRWHAWPRRGAQPERHAAERDVSRQARRLARSAMAADPPRFSRCTVDFCLSRSARGAGVARALALRAQMFPGHRSVLADGGPREPRGAVA